MGKKVIDSITPESITFFYPTLFKIESDFTKQYL